MAVPSVKLGVTVNPPDTSASSVTVKVSKSPSPADVSEIVNAAASSSTITPFALVAFTALSETLRLTSNTSFASAAASSVVATVKVCVSPAVPAKVSVFVFSV